MELINSFSGPHVFLSNFYQQAMPFNYDDINFYTVEHFFQWYKTLDEDFRRRIAEARTPGLAKRLGRQCPMREDWMVIRIDVMELGQVLKYSVDDALGKKLVATGDAQLVEGNTWHDNLWGDCSCYRCKDKPGQNLLGQILMRVRPVIKERLEEKEMIYQLDTGYGCGAVIVRAGKIVDTAPIFKWMRGKTMETAINYLKRKSQVKSFTLVT